MPCSRHAPRQKLAQRWQPERRAVVGKRDIVGTRHSAQRPAESCLRHPGSRQPAAAGFQHIVAGVQRLSRDPQRIDGAIEPGADLGQRQRRQRSGGIKARAGPGTDRAFGGEALIGFDDGGFGYLHGFREGADRGQPRSRRQAARGDPLTDGRHDTFDQSGATGRAHRQFPTRVPSSVLLDMPLQFCEIVPHCLWLHHMRRPDRGRKTWSLEWTRPRAAG